MRITSVAWGILTLFTISLSGCDEKVAEKNTVLRGLKTITIKDTASTSVRRYPTVLQSSDTTTLSFEINGKVGTLNLAVGQRVRAGEALATLDDQSLKLIAESAKATLEQMIAASEKASNDLARQKQLFKRNLIGKAKLEQARTSAKTSDAQVIKAKKQLEIAERDLSRSILSAPFDGVINSVLVDAFETISAGQTIATLYSADSFETRFAVSYDVVNRLAVGQKVIIRPADNPALKLNGKITELGSSASTVSAFPVVARLDRILPELKAGVAVEVEIEISVTDKVGYRLPLSALIIEGKLKVTEDPWEPIPGYVYVYHEDSQTVKRKLVMLAGIKENYIIVTDGVSPGDKIAVAGVAFLREGQKVKLLESDNQ